MESDIILAIKYKQRAKKMKLYLIPFNAEAKVLTAILPNCRKAPNNLFKNRWEYKGGEVISWNEVGTKAIYEVIQKIGVFEKYSSVTLFGSAGSLAPDLQLGEIFCCTTIKDLDDNSWQMQSLEGFKPNSLLTTPELIFDNNKRMEYFKKYDTKLVDMEASIFADLSNKGFFKKAETYIIRFVSDNYEVLPPFDLAKNSYTESFLKVVNKEIIKYRKTLV